MDFRQLHLYTLLYVMNVSREILIEEELFNGIETYIKTAAIKMSEAKPMRRNIILLPKSLMLMESFRLDNLMDPLLKLSNTLITDLTMHATRDPSSEEEHQKTEQKEEALLSGAQIASEEHHEKSLAV